MDWKNKTCKNCMFNINEVCRRFPPKQSNGTPNIYNIADYPRVKNNFVVINACAEYKESL